MIFSMFESVIMKNPLNSKFAHVKVNSAEAYRAFINLFHAWCKSQAYKQINNNIREIIWLIHGSIKRY